MTERLNQYTKDRLSRYRIIETYCHPCKWKVQLMYGRDNNATHLFHPTKEEAKNQIEKEFNGILIETIYLEN